MTRETISTETVEATLAESATSAQRPILAAVDGQSAGALTVA
jgi:hypothetical protein